MIRRRSYTFRQKDHYRTKLWRASNEHRRSKPVTPVNLSGKRTELCCNFLGPGLFLIWLFVFKRGFLKRTTKFREVQNAKRNIIFRKGRFLYMGTATADAAGGNRNLPYIQTRTHSGFQASPGIETGFFQRH
ncbi:hypothetical protein DSECCO2_512560 [anaerobic digester metagenome]